jgi:endonuclease III
MDMIVELGKKRYMEESYRTLFFSKDENADKLIKDIKNTPHAFVLGCLMDRQIPFERAWEIPYKIFTLLGTKEIAELSKKTLNDYKAIFENNKLHRFNDKMSEIFYYAVQDIKNKYDSDASKIWEKSPSSAAVVYRFLNFKGCGIKIATMAANILVRDFHIKLSDYNAIDISPDVHIRRVMARMGYVPQGASIEMVIYKARELNPEFPGIIDISCWDIGRQWCRPQNPDCGNCEVSSQCKKVLD